MPVKSIKQVRDWSGKRVIIRNDFNVPVKNGKIVDDFKIVSQLETVRYLRARKAKLILISHLGRPESKSDYEKMSLAPVQNRLEHYLNCKIKFVQKIDSFAAETAIAKMKGAEVLMFENIRFYKEETEFNTQFAKKIASLGDFFVSDAFGVCHREQSTVSGIQKYIDSFAGFLLFQEIENLEKALQAKKPALAIFGGRKLKTKMPLIKQYLKRADNLLLGGALANNFLAARGYEIGKSLVDNEGIKIAKKIKSKKIVLPLDVVVSSNRQATDAKAKKISVVDKNDYIFDIGPETVRFYASLIKEANSLLWNGPMGFFELKDFRHGTLALARLIASRSKGKAFGVIGGGETVEAMKLTKMIEYVDWVSTGGGAMMTYLSGGKMPGLRNLV